MKILSSILSRFFKSSQYLLCCTKLKNLIHKIKDIRYYYYKNFVQFFTRVFVVIITIFKTQISNGRFFVVNLSKD